MRLQYSMFGPQQSQRRGVENGLFDSPCRLGGRLEKVENLGRGSQVGSSIAATKPTARLSLRDDLLCLWLKQAPTRDSTLIVYDTPRTPPRHPPFQLYMRLRNASAVDQTLDILRLPSFSSF